MSSKDDTQTNTSFETLVDIDSVRLSPSEGRKVIVLYSAAYELYLPIWVGPIEGDVIVSELNNIPHQRCTNLVEQFDPFGSPLKIAITALVDNTYHGSITYDQAGKETSTPMRPSDAICIAIRLKLPIFANNTVLERAGRVGPDTNILIKLYYALKSRLKKISLPPTK